MPTNDNTTLLVTGGAGFIGSALIRLLIRETNCRVVNVDKLTYAGNLESLAEAAESERYAFEQVDICDREALARVFKTHQPDAVMHLAAESHVDRSIEGPGEFIQTNVVGTFNLLEQARSYWNELDGTAKADFRFHHISTDEVYGDLPHPSDESVECSVVSDELQGQDKLKTQHLPLNTKHSKLNTGSLPLFTEKTAYAPSSPYSASKAASDHLVRAWHRTYDVPVLLTNCSNNYGPYQFPEKLIPLMILNALDGKTLPVYGKGENIRDWLYVDDHARALKHVLEHGEPGRTYNIGGRSERTNLEVVQTICNLLDELSPNQLNTKHSTLITNVKDRPGHDRRYAIDDTRIATELGWQPQESFETGLRKTIEWYLANQAWCVRVQDGSYRRQRLGVLSV